MEFKKLEHCMRNTKKPYIIVLLSILFIVLLFSGVSLSGLSTFGILLTALFALKLTKEQVGEWRTKEAYKLCEELERNYKHIRTDINTTINNTVYMKKHPNGSYWAICKVMPLITSGSKDTSYGKCLRDLDFINQHFEALGKTGTRKARELIASVYLLHLKINAFNNMPDESIDENEIRMAVNNINKASQAFENEHGKGVPLSLERYIHDLRLYCIKK